MAEKEIKKVSVFVPRRYEKQQVELVQIDGKNYEIKVNEIVEVSKEVADALIHAGFIESYK